MSLSLSVLVALTAVADPVEVEVGGVVASDSIDRGASAFEGRAAAIPQLVFRAPSLGLEVGTGLHLAFIDRARPLSDGTRCSELDEVSAWFSLGRELGPVAVAGGVTTFQLVGAEAWPEDGASRMELTSSLEVPELFVAPRLDLFWDPSGAGLDGVYAKLSLTANPLEPLAITAHVGATTQNTQASDGLSDLGLTLSWALAQGGLGVSPCGGVMWAADPNPGAPRWLAWAGTELRVATSE